MAESKATGLTVLSRRRFLQVLAAGGMGTAGISLLSACGGAAPPAATPAPAAKTAAPAATAAPATTAAPAAKPAATAAPAAPAATAAAAAKGTPKKGGTIVHASALEAEPMDPTRTTNGESLMIIANIMDGLVNFGRDTMKIEPGIAKSWEISSDGKLYTFQLREGVKFHDGTPVDAEAIKFNYDRVIDEKNPLYRDEMSFARTDLLGSVEKIEATSPTVLKLILKEPFSPLMNCLATPYLKICSPKALKADPDGFGNNPVGSGAFKFSTWTRKATLEIVRNDDYWDDKAYVDKVVFKYVPEASVRLSEVETGSSHLFDSIGVRDVERVKGNPNLVLQMMPYPAFDYAFLNATLPPTDNKKLRQALNYAVNYDGIVKNLFNGLGQLPDAGPLAPGLTGYKSGLSPYKYDPEKAKALMAEAGFASGLKIKSISRNYARPYVPAGSDKVAQAVQADLKKIGIEDDLTILDAAPFLEVARDPAKRPNILYGGWYDDYPDQHQFIASHGVTKAGMNRSSWANAEFDKLINEAGRLTDEAKRAELYQKAAQIWLDDAPMIIFNYGMATSVMRKNLQNAVITPLLTWRFDRMWLSD